MVAFEGTLVWICCPKYGTLFFSGSGNEKKQKLVSFVFCIKHIAFTHQITTDGRTIVYIVPKIFFVLFYLFFRKSIKQKLSIIFFYSKYNSTTIGIRKSRVGIPKTTRETTCCTFEFYVITLCLIEECIKIIIKVLYVFNFYHKLYFFSITNIAYFFECIFFIPLNTAVDVNRTFTFIVPFLSTE